MGDNATAGTALLPAPKTGVQAPAKFNGALNGLIAAKEGEVQGPPQLLSEKTWPAGRGGGRQETLLYPGGTEVIKNYFPGTGGPIDGIVQDKNGVAQRVWQDGRITPNQGGRIRGQVDPAIEALNREPSIQQQQTETEQMKRDLRSIPRFDGSA